MIVTLAERLQAKDKIAKAITLPNGYRLDWAGEFEELEQAQKRLALVVPLVLFSFSVCFMLSSIQYAIAFLS